MALFGCFLSVCAKKCKAESGGLPVKGAFVGKRCGRNQCEGVLFRTKVTASNSYLKCQNFLFKIA